MGILEDITKMKSEGKKDEEIVSELQQRGISPKEINNALSQAQIKSAVSDTEGMQPSITQQNPARQGTYTPQTQEIEEPEMYAPQPGEYAAQEQYPQQEYYPQETYENYSAGGLGSDTMMEIAEQVFSQKIKNIEKQIDSLNGFKTLVQTEIDNTVERLKKIESTIDKLQIAILEKIGSYGKNLEDIKKEMSMMQDSFGKMINPLANRTTTQTIKKTIPPTKTNIRKPAMKKISKKR